MKRTNKMVFWKYDQFPYMISGHLKRVSKDGFMVEGYYGIFSKDSFLFALPKIKGEMLRAQLIALKQSYQNAISFVEAGALRTRDDLISKYNKPNELMHGEYSWENLITQS